jgi:hypothetical protein
MSKLHPHRLLITSVWESQYSPIVDVRWLCNFQGAHLPGRLLPQSFEIAAALGLWRMCLRGIETLGVKLNKHGMNRQ